MRLHQLQLHQQNLRLRLHQFQHLRLRLRQFQRLRLHQFQRLRLHLRHKTVKI